MRQRFSSKVTNIPLPKRMYGSEENQKIIKELKEEGSIRAEIQKNIFDYVYNNKSQLELIEKLNSEPRYKICKEYFEIWIKDISSKKYEIEEQVRIGRKNGKSDEEIFNFLTKVAKYRRYQKYFQQIIASVQIDDEKGIEYE